MNVVKTMHSLTEFYHATVFLTEVFAGLSTGRNYFDELLHHHQHTFGIDNSIGGDDRTRKRNKKKILI